VSGAPRGAPLRLTLSAGILVGLMVLDAAAIWFAYGLFAHDGAVVATIVLIVVGVINAAFLLDVLTPLRWIVPGLALMVIFVLYPVFNTLGVALTNYGNGHLLTKDQAIAQYEGHYYSPPGAPTYAWRAYRASDNTFLLWLTDTKGRSFIGDPRTGIAPVSDGDARFGPKDEDGLPKTIGNYTKLSRLEVFPYLSTLQSFTLQAPEGILRIVSLDAAPVALPKYTYERGRDVLVDHETGAEYRSVDGVFTAADGSELSPGFSANVGLRNFIRAFTDPDVRGPFASVFLWTIAFAFLSVLLTFGLGLGLALVVNDRGIPFIGTFRALSIVPYAVPGFISALVWVGLLNPFYGQFNALLSTLTGVSPQWFSDPTLAKIAILLVNLWLGYPYMLLISLGALQSISSELFEAAAMDGANALQRFRFITLPLLLVALGPLLIGSFAFNFNNFTLIDLVTGGGPPISGTSQPAGATDILISYTVRLAFTGGQGGRGVDYGFAAAISVFIFVIIAVITMANFRFSRQLEQVSENL
jgi:ABC-type sugar transport system permease subunit